MTLRLQPSVQCGDQQQSATPFRYHIFGVVDDLVCGGM